MRIEAPQRLAPFDSVDVLPRSVVQHAAHVYAVDCKAERKVGARARGRGEKNTWGGRAAQRAHCASKHRVGARGTATALSDAPNTWPSISGFTTSFLCLAAERPRFAAGLRLRGIAEALLALTSPSNTSRSVVAYYQSIVPPLFLFHE